MAIGKSLKRVEAEAKVAGRAQYTDDFFIPGMLVAKYLRSTIAHGRVKETDNAKAEAIAKAVNKYKELPQNKFPAAGL